MELGALVCVPKVPRCSVCPIEKDCLARRKGLEAMFPGVSSRGPSVKVNMAAAVVRRKNRVLMYRRSTEELMRGLWELPGGPCRVRENPRKAVIREAKERYGLELEPAREITRVKHNIMNRQITLHAYEANLKDRLGPRNSSRTWVNLESTASLPMSSMTLKVFRAMRSRESNESADE